MKKCERCPKPATLHITDVYGQNQFEALHLCEDCAKKHIYEPEPTPVASVTVGVTLNFEELPDTGDKQCSDCGLKFLEFRNTGRLGCAHDYNEFREELLPLLESIHGETRHQGKSPKRRPAGERSGRELIALRKQLNHAVTSEDYEAAARLRDRIRELEAHHG